MRAYLSTLKLVGGKIPGWGHRSSVNPLVELKPNMVPFSAVHRLSRALGVEPITVLATVGIPQRTAARRSRQGFLKPAEADRLLRVGRVVEEATRIFGSEPKAGRWLTTPQPMLGDATPLSLLDSDAGAQLVIDELVRIDYGDFA